MQYIEGVLHLLKVLFTVKLKKVKHELFILKDTVILICYVYDNCKEAKGVIGIKALNEEV